MLCPSFLLCAFPFLSHLPSSLLSLLTCSSSPYQCLVFKPLFPIHPLSIHCVCLHDVLPEFLLSPVSPWYVVFGLWVLVFPCLSWTFIFDLYFAFFFALCWTVLVVTLSCCCVATFGFWSWIHFLFMHLVFCCIQLCLVKARLLFPLNPASCPVSNCIWIHLLFPLAFPFKPQWQQKHWLKYGSFLTDLWRSVGSNHHVAKGESHMHLIQVQFNTLQFVIIL